MGTYRRQGPESIARRERKIVENMLQVRRLKTTGYALGDDGIWTCYCKQDAEKMSEAYLSRAMEETDPLILEQSLEPPE